MLKMKDGGVVEKPAKVTKADKAEPQLHFVQKTIGNDTWLVMAQSQIELEDEFSTLYYTAQNQSNIFLEPPFDPQCLLYLVQSNNTLNQCIEAMEVNCDGTGYDLVPIEENGDMDQDEQDEVNAFFGEPYPNTSFVKIRRKLRQEMESVGYGYLEILRNLQGELVGFRNVETHNVRFVKLDEPILVKKTISRNDEDVELQMWVRERRFAQRVALKTLVYYKEFGATRDVNRNNGRWGPDPNKSTPDSGAPAPIAPEDKGTELLLFGIHPDIKTPYFIPRWINELPSVIGSRKAEEQNLQFLDSGGMPPAIIFVQGGTLAKDASDQLRMYLSGQNKNKFRAVVVEAQSSSGSLDSAGTVKVLVERFGAEKANDAMFQAYDALTEEHVRVGFRLPPLFLGKPADYNFATAVTAYMIAEAQVFDPERKAFDEIINMTLLKEMGIKTLKLKSNPINLKDPANQMGALAIVKDLATRESMLDEINTLTGFDLKLAPEPQPDTVSGTYVDPTTGMTTQVMNSGRAVPGGPAPVPKAPPTPINDPARGGVQKPEFQQAKPVGALPVNPAAPIKATATPSKTGATKPKKTAIELIDLAHEYATMRGLVRKRELSPERGMIVQESVEALSDEDMYAFNSLIATYAFGSDAPDLVTLVGGAR